MYVIVAGGGKVGYNLTRTLRSNGYEVSIIEKDPARYRWLEDHLGEGVIHGDATEIATLESVGTNRAKVVAAVTGFDEDNIMICRVAEKVFGVSRVIGRVNYPENEDTFHMLGIKHIINSTKLIYRMMFQEVNVSGLIPLLTLKGGEIEFVDIILPDTSPAVNQAIRDLNLPEHSLLLGIIRDEDMIFPKGDIFLQAGDHIIASTATKQAEFLRLTLIGEETET